VKSDRLGVPAGKGRKQHIHRLEAIVFGDKCLSGGMIACNLADVFARRMNLSGFDAWATSRK
jgi:hypothetical protein